MHKLARGYDDAEVEHILKGFADLGRLDHISQGTKPKKDTSTKIETNAFVKLFHNINETGDAELTADVSELRDVPDFTM